MADETSLDHRGGNGVPISGTGWHRSTSAESQSASKSHATHSEGSGSYEETEDSSPPSSFGATGSSLHFFVARRHINGGNPTQVEKRQLFWRMSGKSYKTTQGALIICLNIGCDPPDVVRTQPAAHLECWIDPHTMPPSKALEMIGKALQRQFEILNSRGKYRSYLDPSLDDFKGYMISLRNHTKNNRALVYYNGHGVPKPTSNGEFWVFNRNYTQYIPVSLNDLQDWIRSPTLFIWDCSAAGNILQNFEKFAKPKDEEIRQLYPDGNFPAEYVPLSECIHLLACGADEELPMAPDLPADVFTSCLTSPIEMALRFYVLQNSHRFPDATLESISRIPGDFKDRRTPFGELSWIFTAVTDTIAWSVFSPEIFRKYFRQDLTTASLFRNFLLAERVLRAYDCTPQSLPHLPPTHMHPMWRAWDLAVDSCLAQLPEILKSLDSIPSPVPDVRPMPPDTPLPYRYVPSVFFAEHLTAFEVWLKRGKILNDHTGQHSQIYSIRPRVRNDGHDMANHRHPPEQLPVLLQVLLSQAHRLRALILLSQFMDLGPWAVHYALEIGIFPYVLRLLQSSSPDVRPVLLFIWARILSADPSCKDDLAREIEIKDPQAQGENAPKLKVSPLKYFCEVLMPNGPVPLLIPNVSEHRAMAAFCLSVIVRDHLHGQGRAFIHGAFEQCMHRLEDDDFLLRQWSILCLANLWAERDDYKGLAMEHSAHDKVMELLNDISTEVRASAMYALGTFLGVSSSPDLSHRGGGGTGLLPFNPRDQFRVEIAIGTRAMLAGRDDASPIVRKELVVLLSALVVEWRGWFTIAAWIYWEWDKVNRAHIPDVGKLFILDGDDPKEEFAAIHRTISEWIDSTTLADPRADRDFDVIKEENRVLLSSFFTIWSALFDLSVDPYPEVAAMARTVVDYLMACLVESAFARLPSSALNSFPMRSSGDETTAIARVTSSSQKSQTPRSRQVSLHSNPAIPMNGDQLNANRRASLQRSDSSMSAHALTSTLKRTSSIAASLKNLATGHAFPSSEPGSPLPASPILPTMDPLPLVAIIPEPKISLYKYCSPWNSNARSKLLPAPNPSVPLVENQSATVSAALLPSWQSLSPPNPSFTQSSLTFPSRDRPDASTKASSRTAKGAQLSAKNIMDALVEEDFERQRGRTPWDRKGEVQSYRTSSHKRNTSSLALGRLDTIAETLPLRSTYYDSCAEYYSESQMGLAEIEEPGSKLYNEQMQKRLAAEKYLQDSDDHVEMAESHAWDKVITTLPNDQCVSQLAFHPTEHHILMADRSSNIGLWDWVSRRKICIFHNNNSSGSRITHLQYINNDYHTLVLAGSSDQVVRVYRHCNGDPDPVELVTAFRALNDRVPVKKGSGMILAWQQCSGILLASGDVKAVRVWDAHRELCLQDVLTNAASSVTALAFESDASQIFSVGHADGSLHVYDRRLRSGGYIRSCEGHQSWIRNVHWQKHGGREMISASVDGTVCLWDLRSPIPITLAEPDPYGLESLMIYEGANVFATVTAIASTHWRQQSLNVYSPPGGSSFQPHPSPLGRVMFPTGRSAAPESIVSGLSPLAFHPNEMIIGAGGADGIIRLYGAKPESLKAPHLPFELPRPSSPMAAGIGLDSF